MRFDLKKNIEELKKAAIHRINDKIAAAHEEIEYQTTIGVAYALAQHDKSDNAKNALDKHLALLNRKKAAIESIKLATTGNAIKAIVDSFYELGDLNV